MRIPLRSQIQRVVNKMKIPSDFAQALRDVYCGHSDFDQFFKTQREVILRITRHAMRYRPRILSEEDDLYQEACYWLMQIMWDYDEDKGTTLERYVTYNLGVRLKMHIEKEKAEKRTPSTIPLSINNVDTDTETWDATGIPEERLACDAPDAEAICIAREFYAAAERELPLMGLEFLESLLIEGGNRAAAARRVRRNLRVRSRRITGDDAFRLSLIRNYIPEFCSILNRTHIIPS